MVRGVNLVNHSKRDEEDYRLLMIFFIFLGIFFILLLTFFVLFSVDITWGFDDNS